MPSTDPVQSETPTVVFLNNMLGKRHAEPIGARLIEEGLFRPGEVEVLYSIGKEEDAKRKGAVHLHGKSNGEMIREVWERFRPVAILTLDTGIQHQWYKGKQYDPPPCPVICLSWQQSGPDALDRIGASGSAAVRFAMRDTTEPWFYVQSHAARDEIAPETQPTHVLEHHRRAAGTQSPAGAAEQGIASPPASLTTSIPDQPGMLSPAAALRSRSVTLRR